MGVMRGTYDSLAGAHWMIAPKPDHKLTSSCPRPLHSGYRASSVLIWAGSGLLLFDFRAADAYLRHVVLGMHLRLHTLRALR